MKKFFIVLFVVLAAGAALFFQPSAAEADGGHRIYLPLVLNGSSVEPNACTVPEGIVNPIPIEADSLIGGPAIYLPDDGWVGDGVGPQGIAIFPGAYYTSREKGQMWLYEGDSSCLHSTMRIDFENVIFFEIHP